MSTTLPAPETAPSHLAECTTRGRVTICAPGCPRFRAIREVGPAGLEPAYMSCPRNCGVDVREHNSSELVNGGCDTDIAPIDVDTIRARYRHGAGPVVRDVVALVREIARVEALRAELAAEVDRLRDQLAAMQAGDDDRHETPAGEPLPAGVEGYPLTGRIPASLTAEQREVVADLDAALHLSQRAVDDLAVTVAEIEADRQSGGAR